MARSTEKLLEIGVFWLAASYEYIDFYHYSLLK